MKAALFLLLALGAASTSACSSKYSYCHCTDSTGSANDTATMLACIWDIGIIQPYPGDSWHECYSGDDWDWDNCDFRVKCTYVGTSGQDSNCRT
jgi:hypothetical protein